MRNQIHFRETRSRHVPAIGLHRNVVLEQIARLGAPVNPPSPLRLLRFQPAVHLPRTDLQQLLCDLRPHAKALANRILAVIARVGTELAQDHPSWPFVLLSDSAHKLPADTPIAPCFPTP